MSWRQSTVWACALGFLFAFGCAGAAGETVLLDFQTDWCGYCRMMEPVVEQLSAEGYRIRRINGDLEPDLVQKFRVEGYPTFVALRDNREVGRLSGRVTEAQLKQLLGKPDEKTGGWQGVVRGQSPDTAAITDVRSSTAGGWEAAGDAAVEARTGVPPIAAAPVFNRHPLISASVRLRIQDHNGQSVGSGTIIDSRDNEALVLTCGHMFREWKESGQILVDLFGPGAPQQVPATLVSYDLNSDVGLVRIEGDYRFVAARVAPASYRPRKGEAVVSVGCDNGADATERATQIVSLDRYTHAPNLQVAFEPVQGRSGGGLFNARGEVIGVCNAADADEKQGLFAALRAIHAELDRAKLSFVYNNSPGEERPIELASGLTGEPTALLADAQHRFPPSSRGGEHVERRDGDLTADERALLSELRSVNGTEVICLVRSLDDPQAKSRVFQINRASAAFWRELAESGYAPPHGRRLTSLDQISTASSKADSIGGGHATQGRLRKAAVPAGPNVWPLRTGTTSAGASSR